MKNRRYTTNSAISKFKTKQNKRLRLLRPVSTAVFATKTANNHNNKHLNVFLHNKKHRRQIKISTFDSANQ